MGLVFIGIGIYGYIRDAALSSGEPTATIAPQVTASPEIGAQATPELSAGALIWDVWQYMET